MMNRRNESLQANNTPMQKDLGIKKGSIFHIKPENQNAFTSWIFGKTESGAT
jgi:hypothetical protein